MNVFCLLSSDRISAAATVFVAAAAAHVIIVVVQSSAQPATATPAAAVRPTLVVRFAASRAHDHSSRRHSAVGHQLLRRRRRTGDVRHQSHDGRSHGQHVHGRLGGRGTSPVLRHRSADIHRPDHRPNGLLVPVRLAQLPAAGRLRCARALHVHGPVSRRDGRLLPGPRLRSAAFLLRKYTRFLRERVSLGMDSKNPIRLTRRPQLGIVLATRRGTTCHMLFLSDFVRCVYLYEYSRRTH